MDQTSAQSFCIIIHLLRRHLFDMLYFTFLPRKINDFADNIKQNT